MSGHATRPGDPGGQAVLEHCIQVAVSPIAGKHVTSSSATSVPPMERQDADVSVRKRIKACCIYFNNDINKYLRLIIAVHIMQIISDYS